MEIIGFQPIIMFWLDLILSNSKAVVSCFEAHRKSVKLLTKVNEIERIQEKEGMRQEESMMEQFRKTSERKNEGETGRI